MNPTKLGDSYDAVKYLWQQLLTVWKAPLYAEPQFVPEDLRADYTRLTNIAMLPTHRPRKYSILNDPDTGIRLPGNPIQAEGQTHVAMGTIIHQVREQHPCCVVTFDQSHYRRIGRTIRQQRNIKLEYLRRHRIPAFYYDSHAWFLFAFPSPAALQNLRLTLIRAGIPEARLQERVKE